VTHPKHASTEHQILDVIRRRWSPRAFDPSREIPSGDLRSLFEAARWAPSSFNEQPWRFVVTDVRRTPEAFAGLMQALDTFNQTWARNAPLLVLAAAATHLKRSGGLNRSAWYDAGQAVAFLTLQATSLGLGIRQMEGFDRDAARRVCNVPDDYEPVVVMAIGYPGDPDALAGERERFSERQPRQRQPTETFVFEGVWGAPLGGVRY
jgi:nitroreductase